MSTRGTSRNKPAPADAAPTLEPLLRRATTPSGGSFAAIARLGRRGLSPDRAMETLIRRSRAESIAEKPAFRAAARERRCIIPATGFFEWTKDEDGNRLPWYIHPTGKGPLAFAGIWQDWTKGETPLATCAIVTCAANGTMASLHHRMPVILAPKDWALWLGEAGKGAAALMRAAPEDALAWHRVDRAVNSNRASGPDLIAPLAA